MAVSTGANAGPILSPIDATIISGGPGDGAIGDTFNGAGLSTGFTSGVTDFDTYMAGNPLHTIAYPGFEWFSESGTNSASVTYDLGFAQNIDAIALWNEESSGIGVLDLLVSVDGVNFSSVLTGVLPTDPGTDAELKAGVKAYPADVFSFAALPAQYIQLNMSGCPQEPDDYSSCSIGEVAFRVAQAIRVPEPASLVIFTAGLAGLIWFVRRRHATRRMPSA